MELYLYKAVLRWQAPYIFFTKLYHFNNLLYNKLENTYSNIRVNKVCLIYQIQ